MGGKLWSRRRRPASRPTTEAAHDSLRRQVERLEREKALAQEILERMEEGVLVFSESLAPIMANHAARRLLDIEGETLPARVAPETMLSIARRALVDGKPAQDVVSMWPGQRRLRVRADLLQGEGGVIVVLKDVTDELRMQAMRRQFVANASHELKSPVAGLQALAEAIGEATRDDPEATQRFAGRLATESERLARLIADLLDLSRLEDPTNVSNAQIDVSQVVGSVLDEVKPSADAKKLSVQAHISIGARARGDEYQLVVLVRNLVDNAIRYTPEGGSISVELLREASEIVLRVADNGIGIPLQAQGRIFERFYRVDKDRSRERGGTGLGLSIVKHVVELHGGHVSVESELGEGSTFTARLPALRDTQGSSLEVSPAHRDPH